MSDITIGAIEINGFNANNIGVDVALSGLTVTLSDDQVTGSSVFPQRVVGMGGFQIDLGTPAVNYDVESIESRSALTLTTNYLASSGTVTGTLHKWVELRIYALNSFTPSGSSEPIQQGTPHSSQWFRRYGASIVNDGVQNVLHLPQIVLPATTDSSNPTARYFAGLYAPAGYFLQAFPSNSSGFQLDADTTPTSWAQIIAFNTPSPPHPSGVSMDSFYTKAEIDARFPSGLQNQLIYYAATGNVFTPLDLSSDFTIVADELQLSASSGYDQIQEEGANLPQQNTLNFVGSAFTAADDAGNNRTNVTADADLDALASNSTNGFWARTGAGTGAARTITGTANEITSTNGDGVAGNPTLSLPAALTFTGKTVTGGQFNNPRIGTALLDTSGNEIIETPATASAVNHLRATNAATGNPADLSAQGDDAAVALNLATKSTGNFTVTTNSIPRVTVAGADAHSYLGNGITNAAPESYGLNATGGSGTNTFGANVNLAGGKGTGTGLPGAANVRYPLTTGSGTSLQSLSVNVFPISTSLYTNVTVGTTVTNTTTETSLFTGATPSTNSIVTIEGGSSRVGTVYRLRAYLLFNTTGTPTIRFRLKLGSTTVADTTAFTAPTVSGLAYLDMLIFVNTLGAAGLVRAQLEGRLTSVTTGLTTNTDFSGAAGEVAVDTTADQAIDLTAQWGAAAAGNQVQLLSIYIDRMR